MDKTERNNLIIRMAAEGETVAKIAATVQLTSSGVRRILARNSRYITSRSPPTGMSIRTAWLIEQATGYWPEQAAARMILARRFAFMRYAGTRRADWIDLDAWLVTLGYPSLFDGDVA